MFDGNFTVEALEDLFELIFRAVGWSIEVVQHLGGWMNTREDVYTPGNELETVVAGVGVTHGGSRTVEEWSHLRGVRNEWVF